MSGYQFLPLRPGRKPNVVIYFDNSPIRAFRGETVISALLRQQSHLSYSEFDGAPRAGFCLMGACQDCSVWTEEGKRLRACRALVEDNQRLVSRAPMHGFQA